MNLLLVHRRVLAKAPALTYISTVIPSNNDRGIFAQACGVKGFEKPSKAVVHPRNLGRITRFEACFGFIGQIGIVASPTLKCTGIKPPIVTGGFVVFEHKGRGHIPRFVGIEAVNPQEEIFSPRIIPQELSRGIEQLRAIPVVQICASPIGSGIRVIVFCQIRVFAQNIEYGIFAPVARPLRFIVHPCAIHFCTANKRPRVKGIIKSVPTVDEMRRIVNELCRVSRFAQHRGKRPRVKRQGLPGVERTAVFPGHNIRAIGNGGKAGGKSTIKTP